MPLSLVVKVFRDMSMEGRMTVCNMAIEGGARVGMVAVDDKTIAYVKDRPICTTKVHSGIKQLRIGIPYIRMQMRILTP